MKKYLVFLGILSIVTGVFFYFQIFIPLNNSGGVILFHIEKGEGNYDIASHLQESLLIRSRIAFHSYVLFTGNFHELKAGNYELSSRMSIAEISRKIISGDIAKKTLTIIEGWNRKDIAAYLETQGITEAARLRDSSYDALEGYLFPDTYQVRIGATLEEIVALMKKNFDEKIEGVSREMVIMASLIEKEVRTLEDKRIVSGILWKRLHVGMPLQVDATVTYVIGKQKISIADTKIDSPYNTYRYKGLPIGPIANPGLESIQAAMEPKESQYLFYLSTPDGKTIFSKTLGDHNRAKARYF